MVRVTRPGGRIVMGNWIPGDPTLVAQILRISAAYTPPPPEGFISPMTWGMEDHVVERFAGAGVPRERISFGRETYTFNFAGAPSEFVAAFRQYYGPRSGQMAGSSRSERPHGPSDTRFLSCCSIEVSDRRAFALQDECTCQMAPNLPFESVTYGPILTCDLAGPAICLTPLPAAMS
jgi:hypothetical protein